jgi:protein SCO1/2
MKKTVALTPLAGGFLLPVILSLGILGCGRSTPGGASPYRGTILPTPWPKVDFSLTATDGERFDFRRETEGFVTLLFFGYTSCPDICPVHMANIAAVLGKLPPTITNQVKVVFVSTDPARDKPERIREWLDHFDADFIGLRGSLETVNAIQQEIGLPPAVAARSEGEEHTVGHAAQVIAYTRDDSAHVVYPFGTRQTDWAHDLPKLVVEDWEGEMP